MSKRVKGGNSSEITKLDVAKRGRKVVLGEKLDNEIKCCVQ